MKHAYNELYLDKARASMAVMLDFAVHDLRQDAGDFFDLFITSGIAERFGRGDIRICAGMSGIELAYMVLELSGMPAERVSYRFTSGRSKEYWTGWALAGCQWEAAATFAEIVNAVPVKDMIAMCDEYRDNEIREISASLSWMDNLKIPDHMNPDNYRDFCSRIDAQLKANRSGSQARLKSIRQQSGLSQSQLAAASGIPVRTIQQYEQRQKNINKAGFDSIIKLAAALCCEPEALLE